MTRHLKAWLIAALVAQVPPAAGVDRDPFLPAVDPCATAIQQARYQGAIINANHSLALVTFDTKHWQRWHLRESPAPGWQVRDISSRDVTLTGPAGCPPLRLRLAREEVKDEKQRNSVPAAAAAESAAQGRRAE